MRKRHELLTSSDREGGGWASVVRGSCNPAGDAGRMKLVLQKTDHTPCIEVMVEMERDSRASQTSQSPGDTWQTIASCMGPYQSQRC